MLLTGKKRTTLENMPSYLRFAIAAFLLGSPFFLMGWGIYSLIRSISFRRIIPKDAKIKTRVIHSSLQIRLLWLVGLFTGLMPLHQANPTLNPFMTYLIMVVDCLLSSFFKSGQNLV